MGEVRLIPGVTRTRQAVAQNIDAELDIELVKTRLTQIITFLKRLDGLPVEVKKKISPSPIGRALRNINELTGGY